MFLLNFDLLMHDWRLGKISAQDFLEQITHIPKKNNNNNLADSNRIKLIMDRIQERKSAQIQWLKEYQEGKISRDDAFEMVVLLQGMIQYTSILLLRQIEEI